MFFEEVIHKMSTYPLVSILSTFKDSKDMLILVMASVLSQDYPNIEHIIIDSASIDGSVELLHEYEKLYSNSNCKLKWKSEPDKCIPEGANKAAALMTGDYFIFLTNPFISTSSLSTLMNHLIDESLDAVCGGVLFHKEGIVIRRWKGNKWNWRFGWMAMNETLCMKKELFVKHGPFNEDFNNAFDYDFQVQIFKDKETRCKSIKVPLVYFYAGGTSGGSTAGNIVSIKENIAILKHLKISFAVFTVLCKCIAAFLAYTFVYKKDISKELAQLPGMNL